MSALTDLANRAEVALAEIFREREILIFLLYEARKRLSSRRAGPDDLIGRIDRELSKYGLKTDV